MGLPRHQPHAAVPVGARGHEQERTRRRALLQLTPRELEVLALTSRGVGERTIAMRRGITVQTVNLHQRAIATKLGITAPPWSPQSQQRDDAAQATIDAQRLGPFPLRPSRIPRHHHPSEAST
jgi:DNA-binding NarL/FixJ family response regulator